MVGSRASQEACRAAAAWPVGRDGGAPWVSVNVSVRQLLQADLVERLLAAAAAAGLAPRRLVLELAEEAARRESLAADHLRRLRAAGLRIAIDDFGSGVSALASLDQLPTDFLKLDRAFLVASDGRPGASSLLRGIVQLGLGLGFELIGEGVENDRQAAILASLGCRLGQGFHLGRPMAAEEAALLLAAPRRALPILMATRVRTPTAAP